jgi:hypothetical protein
MLSYYVVTWLTQLEEVLLSLLLPWDQCYAHEEGDIIKSILKEVEFTLKNSTYLRGIIIYRFLVPLYNLIVLCTIDQ